MNQTIKIFRNGIVYGIVFFALACMLGNLFNVPLNQTLLMAGSIGFAALVINGSIHRKFSKSLKTLEAITISPEELESVKIQAPANYTIDEHLVPGKLFLTDKRLVFIPCQREEHTQQEYSWPLTNQQSFNFYPTIFNAGGEFIINSGGNSYVFEVDELKAWKKALLTK